MFPLYEIDLVWDYLGFKDLVFKFIRKCAEWLDS